MSFQLLEFSWQILPYVFLPFVIGLASTIVYKKFRDMFFPAHDEDTIVAAIVSEYTRRLANYEKAIADLRVNMKIMESRLAHQQPSQEKSTSLNESNITSSIHRDTSLSTSQAEAQSYHKSAQDKPLLRKQEGRLSVSRINPPEMQNGTTDYILKLLNDKARTSREVQLAIGRTREHTSRLMKKLYESNLVTRDNNSKPFKYAITSFGRVQLSEGHHVMQGITNLKNDVTSRDYPTDMMT
jgi:hypothetical protein